MSRLLTIADIKARLPGVSERTLRVELKRQGCASKIGRQLFVTEDQFRQFVEVMTCSGSTSAAASGTSVAPLPVDAFERALALATATQPSASAPKRKPGHIVSISTARARKQHSQTQP